MIDPQPLTVVPTKGTPDHILLAGVTDLAAGTLLRLLLEGIGPDSPVDLLALSSNLDVIFPLPKMSGESVI